MSEEEPTLALNDVSLNKTWLLLQPPSDEERFFIIFGDDGELVRISMKTGKVTLPDPSKVDLAAEQFWKAIETAFGKLR